MNRIALHSVPRSGSTWLGQILNSSPIVVYKYQPLFSYAFKDRLNPNSTSAEIMQFFNEIAACDDDFLDQTEAVENGLIPKFAKSPAPQFCVYKEVRYHHILSNLLSTDKEIKVIGLVRNPNAVMASWIKAPKEFKPDWNFATEWREAHLKNADRIEEFYGFNKWKEVASLFLDLKQQYPERFKLVSYSSLLEDTSSVVRKIFEFLNIPWNTQTEDFLSRSRSVEHGDAYSVFKKRRNDSAWKEIIPPEISQKIAAEISNTPLEKFAN